MEAANLAAATVSASFAEQRRADGGEDEAFALAHCPPEAVQEPTPSEPGPSSDDILATTTEYLGRTNSPSASVPVEEHCASRDDVERAAARST
eukprot:4650738-Alexandrium_andersonii.AAC.1